MKQADREIIGLLGQIRDGASEGGGASYLVYTMLLTQSGTSAPTAAILENTLSGVPALARTGLGQYTLSLAGAFPANKWWAPDINRWDASESNYVSGEFSRLSDNALLLSVRDNGGTLSDLHDVEVPIEIRVYP